MKVPGSHPGDYSFLTSKPGGPDQSLSALIVGFFLYLAFIAPVHAQTGPLDPAFDPKPNGAVAALAVQGDGGLIIGGGFTQVGMTSRNRIARLNPDGSVDPNFDPGTGPNGSVSAIAVQSYGKILIGGQFSDVSGTPRGGLASLFSGGGLDASFNPRNSDGSGVFALFDVSVATEGNDRVVAQGILSSGQWGVVRFNSDGNLDPTYNPATDPYPFAPRQSDGKLLIVDGGQTIKRINLDNSFDSSFNSIQLGGGVFPNCSNITAIAVQPNDKIIFATLTCRPFSDNGHVLRLDPDGNLDNGFSQASANIDIFAITVQHDGGIVVGGQFSTVNGVPRSGLARLMTPRRMRCSRWSRPRPLQPKRCRRPQAWRQRHVRKSRS